MACIPVWLQIAPHNHLVWLFSFWRRRWHIQHFLLIFMSISPLPETKICVFYVRNFYCIFCVCVCAVHSMYGIDPRILWGKKVPAPWQYITFGWYMHVHTYTSMGRMDTCVCVWANIHHSIYWRFCRRSDHSIHTIFYSFLYPLRRSAWKYITIISDCTLCRWKTNIWIWKRLIIIAIIIMVRWRYIGWRWYI